MNSAAKEAGAGEDRDIRKTKHNDQVDSNQCQGSRCLHKRDHYDRGGHERANGQIE